MTDNQRIDQHLYQKFKIIKKLGSGAYGHVWKVQDIHQTTQIFALKKVFDAFQHATDAQRTFRQISILKKIEHPNIVKLFQVISSVSGKDIYLVFEYMNTDLYHVIYEGIIQQIHKKYIAYQLLLGIYYLHSANLIHRDLKPSNLLLNQNCSLKICDFGLVRYIGGERQQEVVMTEGVATRWYRAPQILVGSCKYNEKADIWSIGCIIAEMYLKSPLFNCNSTIKQLQKIIQVFGYPKSEELKDINNQLGTSFLKQFQNIKQKSLRQTFNSGINDQCLDLIVKLMKFNKNQRFSAEEALKHPYFKGFYKESDLKKSQKELIIQADDNLRLKKEDYKQLILKNFVQNRQPQRSTLKGLLKQTKNEPSRFSDLRKTDKSFGKVLQDINNKRSSLDKSDKQVQRKNMHLFEQLLREKGSSGNKESRISNNSRLRQDKQNKLNNDNLQPQKNLQKFINPNVHKTTGTFAALRKVNNCKFNK